MTNETQIVPTVAKPVAPWIGVGESGEWNSVMDAMDACGLNFHVTDKDLQFSWDDEQDDGSALTYYNTVPGYKATVRTDTHDPLGVVSNTYHIVQNEDIFSMLEPFVKMGGTITHGGMTAQGLCFMIVTMENANVAGDDYTINVMATNSFNGAFPATLICTRRLSPRTTCLRATRTCLLTTLSVLSLFPPHTLLTSSWSLCSRTPTRTRSPRVISPARTGLTSVVRSTLTTTTTPQLTPITARALHW